MTRNTRTHLIPIDFFTAETVQSVRCPPYSASPRSGKGVIESRDPGWICHDYATGVYRAQDRDQGQRLSHPGTAPAAAAPTPGRCPEFGTPVAGPAPNGHVPFTWVPYVRAMT